MFEAHSPISWLLAHPLPLGAGRGEGLPGVVQEVADVAAYAIDAFPLSALATGLRGNIRTRIIAVGARSTWRCRRRWTPPELRSAATRLARMSVGDHELLSRMRGRG